jgi:LacI family transcriptional regulator
MGGPDLDGSPVEVGAVPVRAPVTLRDVAARAQVHPSTASRALNRETRASVSAATASRVLDAARALDYRPNSLARGLRTNRTFTIGMVVPDLTNPLFPPIARGLEDRLNEQGYQLILANTDDDDAKEQAVLEMMSTRRVDGLVLATARASHPVLGALAASQAPIVLVNRGSDEDVSSVTGDDHAGIGLAVKHLVELGHRRIAFVGGSRATPTGLARYQSFTAWIESEGVGFDPTLVAFAGTFTEDEGAEAVAQLLDGGAEFTAVVTGNDLIALGVYDVARARGLRVPEDISVVGYNDIPFCENFHPPLTTIRVPLRQIGEQAAELILAAVEDPGATMVSVRLQPTLVVRESTARHDG